MTGYGRSDFQIDDDGYFVEIRSLNHRYLDIKLRVSERLVPLEHRIRDALKKRVSRGALTLSIYADAAAAEGVKLNIEAARAYLEAAAVLKNETGVKGDIDVAGLMKLRDVFTPERGALDAEEAWGPLAEGLAKALDQVNEWRAKEGAALEKDLRGRLDTVGALLTDIEAYGPKVIAAYREKLSGEMAKILEKMLGTEPDEARILQEAALFAARSDINEEIVRTRSHIEMFLKYLDAGEPVGKRLDFLCQEIFREINTIASKSNDAYMKHTAVEMKGELERIREQVQNIE
jgi:uncharacterized protein (TIGR00255 family)